MANLGYVEGLLGGLTADIKRVFHDTFQYVLGNLKLGPASHQGKSENFQAYYLTSTTAASTGSEFTILHGMARAPYVIVPVLPVNSTGTAFVRLRVPRVADAQRIYLQAPDSTNVAFAILAE